MHPLIHLSEHIALPSYMLIITSVFILGVLWVIYQCQSKRYDLKSAIDISLAIMVGGFLGARLLHVVFELPGYYLEDPLRVFEIWNGGFVFYGGALGAFFTSLALVKWKKLDYGFWADFFAPAFPLGYAVGRLACLLNGCCYGRQCELPWAISIPGQSGLRHPTQAYASLLELLLFFSLLWVIKNRESLKGLQAKGQVFHLWVLGHGINRLIMEFFRDDFRGPSLFSLSISSWISLGLITGALIALRSFSQKKRLSDNESL